MVNGNSRNARLIEQIADSPFRTDRGGLVSLSRDWTLPFRHVSGKYGAFALEQAAIAREEYAQSYRDFKVGVFAAVWNQRHGAMANISGANYKPDESQDIKICAEDILWEKIRRGGFTLMSLMAVVGPVQEDRQSERLAETLHPCGLCRGRMDKSSVVDNDDTLIITGTPDLSVVELTTVNGLNRFHEEGDEGGLITCTLGPNMSGWEENVQPHIDKHIQKVLYKPPQIINLV